MVIQVGNLASNVGGTLGLWFGFSILTIFEFFEFFWDLFYYWLRKCCCGSGTKRQKSGSPAPHYSHDSFNHDFGIFQPIKYESESKLSNFYPIVQDDPVVPEQPSLQSVPFLEHVPSFASSHVIESVTVLPPSVHSLVPSNANSHVRVVDGVKVLPPHLKSAIAESPGIQARRGYNTRSRAKHS